MTNAVTNIEKMLQDVEVKQMMAIYQTKNLEDAAAMFAAIYSSAKQSFRLHVTQDLCCTSEDVDRAIQGIEKFFLEHPESL